MKMTNEQAIKQMNEIIACWEDFLASEENNDLQGTGLELGAMRLAVQALKSSPRWIPCKERMPKLHKEEFDDEVFQASDRILFCSATGVHCGCCEHSVEGPLWYTEEGVSCENIIAWMPLPEVYKED